MKTLKKWLALFKHAQLTRKWRWTPTYGDLIRCGLGQHYPVPRPEVVTKDYHRYSIVCGRCDKKLNHFECAH